MILSLIYQTIIITILLTFSFGPSFFSLLNYSIKKGFKVSAILATGVVASDLFICLLNVLLVHLGMAQLLNDPKNQRFAAILAGIILIVFGAFYFKKPTPKIEDGQELLIPNSIDSNHALLFLKGFVINLFNPTVWLLWLGNVTIISRVFDNKFINILIYFIMLNGVVLAIELYKIHLGNKLKKFLNDRVVHITNQITGVALIIFGIVLIYNYYFEKL